MSLTTKLNSKSNIKQLSRADLPVVPRQPVVNRYSAESTLNQTQINFGFMVDSINAADSVLVIVDGKTLTLGSTNDYTFTNVDSFGMSNQVTLTSSLAGGLNIQVIKLGLKKETEMLQDSRFSSLYESQEQALQAFLRTADVMVATSTVGTPPAGSFYSTISNRSSIQELRSDLKVRMNFERRPLQTAYVLSSEFGPNGELVQAPSNDFFNQVRFVGSGWNNVLGASVGVGIASSVTNDYIEITAYCTGLNILTTVNDNSKDVRASVDGGSEGSNMFGTAESSILLNRNYSQMVARNVSSGLSLGVHTFKIRLNAANTLTVFGYELLTETTSLQVNPGSMYSGGKKITTAVPQVISYNTGFESGTLGTRGGHVVVYQKSDGTIAKAVTPTDSSSATLSSANHQNEEISRIYHWREFGAGRSDDFSNGTLSAASRGFTLEDGTTTLAGTSSLNSETVNSNDAVYAASGSYYTLTFVGTGLDAIMASSGNRNTNISVDGAANVNIVTSSATAPYLQKIVSGLPYGTHTVKIAANTSPAAASLSAIKFMVYQPKKPTIPAGAIELCEYNIVADYSFTGTIGAPSTGVIRKTASREFTYVGTWNSPIIDPLGQGGVVVGTSAAGAYYEYLFYGVGVDVAHYHNTGTASTNMTLSLDGSSNLSGYTTSSLGPSITSFTPSTGVIVFSNTAGNNTFSIRGLTLGFHRVRMTWNSGGTSYASAIDIISPMYAAKSNLGIDLQNTLPVGSTSISDSRKVSAIKDTNLQRKNVSQAFGITSNPTTTSTVFVPMPNMSVVHENNTGRIRISYSAVAYNGNVNGDVQLQIYVDGMAVGRTRSATSSTATARNTLSDEIEIPVSIGRHKVDVYWCNDGAGTVTARTDFRSMLVEDV